MTVAGRPWVYWTLVVMLLLALLVPIAGCGGDDETTTTATPATTAAPTTTAATAGGPASSDVGAPPTSVTFSGDEALIAATWTEFFDGSLPMAGKAALLENGDQYTKELETQAASPMAQAATASVTAVDITSPTTAEVTFSLLLAGQMALPDQKGQAVLQDGVWKVGANTFLALAALQGGAVPTTAAP